MASLFFSNMRSKLDCGLWTLDSVTCLLSIVTKV